MRTRRVTITAILAALALMLGIVPATGASAAPATPTAPDGITLRSADGPVRIQAFYRQRNYNSGKCLVVRTGQGDAPAVQTTCASYRDQYWEEQYVRTTPQGYLLYRIQGDAFGQCLTVRTGNSNAQAVQFPCYDYADQLWYIGDNAKGHIYINYNSGKCLLARTNAAEAPVVQDVCNVNFNDQFWNYH